MPILTQEEHDLITTTFNAINMQDRTGVDINTIIITGHYEVDTNLPHGMTLAELRVGEIIGAGKIIQELRSMTEPIIYRRQHTGGNWSQWVESAQTLFNVLVGTEISSKVTTSQVSAMIINKYSGLSIPDQSLGKNLDKYHRYPTEQISEIGNGVAGNSYNPAGFGIFLNTGVDLDEIWIDPSKNIIEFYWKRGTKPDFSAINLSINGIAIPLTIEQDLTDIYIGRYDIGSEATIIDIIPSDPVVISIKSLSGVDYEYEKRGGSWHRVVPEPPTSDGRYDLIVSGEDL
ncbi:MAG: hypothetical protein KAH30_03375, partial [Caldisericia bacterium]|nr:hypothetical protein [Caldisericia bacterium]